MKKNFLALIAALTLLCFAYGCKKSVDYSDYISEKRTNIYLYEGDDAHIKIHCSSREQPYAADGIKGKMNPLIEIFVGLPKNPEEVCVSVNGFEGEMNFRAVENEYYLSFTAEDFATDSVDVKLTLDGKEASYKALSVKHKGILSPEEALKCAVEHDGELFKSLTSGRLFDGEIYVRLLSDQSCYYYVGVCDKSGNIKAFLIDAEKGKVIATKELKG